MLERFRGTERLCVPLGGFLRELQGKADTESLPCMEVVRQAPPDKPNAYSDGSVSFPSEPRFARAGWGLHVPGRCDDSPLLPDLADF
eukprot:12300854-Alexandrium_andersonii.AAC.1